MTTLDTLRADAHFAVRVCTENDINGNPRRGWLVHDSIGRVLAFINEGFGGMHALRAAVGDDCPESSRVDVTPETFASIRASAPEIG